MAAASPIRRRVPPLAALAVAAALALSGCADAPADTAPPRLDGLLLLTGDLRATTAIDTCVGQPCRMEVVDAPDGTTWIASGRRGVLAATLVDATLRTSDPLDPGGGQSWKQPKLVDAEGAAVDGPFMFPGWDPAGTRFAALAGQLDDDPRLVVVDPTEGTALEILLDAPVVPAPPVWLGKDRIAVVTGEDTDLTTTVITVTTGDPGPGPDGARLLATAADARTIAVARPGREPVKLLATSDWLAGGGSTVASIDPPDKAVAATSLALDADGSRLAIAWLTEDGTVRVLAYTRAGDWRPAEVTGKRNPAAAVVAWSR
jgi:hypothetical protein